MLGEASPFSSLQTEAVGTGPPAPAPGHAAVRAQTTVGVLRLTGLQGAGPNLKGRVRPHSSCLAIEGRTS